jgi:hypothetical protein
MANYAEKLANMRSRRRGLDSVVALNKSVSFAEDSVNLVEAYESRGTTEAVKYALGAMQALEEKYTKISIEEGDRVRDQLRTGLNNAGIPVEFEYQGSVPLNIHIRFASDIDLLVLHGGFVTLDWTGPRAGGYTQLGGSVWSDMVNLRTSCESVLEAKFPAVKVDKTGSKSIALTGGSLRRKVDVVPSHWHDTAAYQQSRNKWDREVRILDKDAGKLISNRPFLHMQSIEDKDVITDGGAKKAIRLLKNIKRDSSHDIKLTSYDIAGLVWHLDNNALRKPYYLELSLLVELQNYLQYLIDNPAYAKTLIVPDGSRKILDSNEKLQSLKWLKSELDELLESIAQELNPLLTNRALAIKQLREARIF